MDNKDFRHQGDENLDHQPHDEHHIVSIPLYLMVFGVLVVGTILTVGVAFIDLDHIFPGANTLVALSIAFFQNGVRRFDFYARALEFAPDLADGDCRIFLAGDYVRLYDAGLPDALTRHFYRINFYWRRTSRNTKRGVKSRDA